MQKNDTQAEAIAKAGQSLVRDLLQPHRLYCYYHTVFQVQICHSYIEKMLNDLFSVFLIQFKNCRQLFPVQI